MTDVAFSRKRRPVGPGAAALKYDILTALLVSASCGDATLARLSIRLSLLISARYNWQRETFAVGRAEMARMWGVTERTAKREIAHMKARGWITVFVPAARGRVAQYNIDFDSVLDETRPFWEAVGPDFSARMMHLPEPEPEAGNVVPIRKLEPVADDGSDWSKIARRLQAMDPAQYHAWFAQLKPVELCGAELTLLAPTKFIASYVSGRLHNQLLAAASAEISGLRSVKVEA